MSESALHIALVRTIRDWALGQYGPVDWGFYVLADLPESKDKPPMVCGFRPDVLARNSGTGMTLIGEAKTSQDLKITHTFAQLRAYLGYLRHVRRPVLAVAVPWQVKATTIGIVRRLLLMESTKRIEWAVLAGGGVHWGHLD